MNIVITDKISLAPSGYVSLKQIPGIRIYDDTVNDPKVIVERLRDAEVCTANYIDLTKEIIEALPKLKYIISPAKGYDWIDSKTATDKGIKLLNCPTFNAQAVAEHAIALIFSVKRKILEANKSLLSGNYDSKLFVGTEVEDKLLVTIGHGEIGKRVLKMANGLGMKTDYVDSKSTPEKFNQLISKADILVLCLSLNDKTREIMNSDKLTLMKHNSILINVARGLIVDQEALFNVLKNNKIAGAGIDTFPKDETITKPSKEILDIAELSNVVATPHIAYNTTEASERLGQELIEDIKSCIENKPKNVVN